MYAKKKNKLSELQCPYQDKNLRTAAFPENTFYWHIDVATLHFFEGSDAQNLTLLLQKKQPVDVSGSEH